MSRKHLCGTTANHAFNIFLRVTDSNSAQLAKYRRRMRRFACAFNYRSLCVLMLSSMPKLKQTSARLSCMRVFWTTESAGNSIICGGHICLSRVPFGRRDQTIIDENKILSAFCPRARRLRYCDSQNLSQADRRRTKADVGNVERAIWTEGHSRREKES